jgi:hypothetical protein
VYAIKEICKKQGSYWIKTNENTGWWIEIEGGYYTTITNGSTSQLVPKYLIIDIQQNQQEQKQNHYHQHQQNQNQELQELQQQELQEQEFQQQQNQPNQDGPGNSFVMNELERVNELERNELQRERKSQVKCQKCGLEGSYVKRKVKSHYYLYIRHKTNGKIKECLISRIT